MSSVILDPDNQTLWRDGKTVALTEKAFAVLHHLAQHPHQLVTKDALFEAVWPNLYITEDVIRQYIKELRKVLGDDPKLPHLIETVHGRGYRFIGVIDIRNMTALPALAPPEVGVTTLVSLARYALTELSGRTAELEQLRAWLNEARQGTRQIGFISGEPGMGKTALVATFLQTLATQGLFFIAHGQCSELYGTQEPFMPVLEMLEELCRTTGNEQVMDNLRSYAPSWYALMPGLAGTVHPSLSSQDIYRDRMLRELAHFLEITSFSRCLVLWFDDLHWADESTLSLIAYLALRRQPANLLLLCTKQPVELHPHKGPLRKLRDELRKHGHYAELRLPLLNVRAVTDYLTTHHPGLPADLGRLIYQHTLGYPLFMVKTIDHLAAQGKIVQDDQHWELRQMDLTRADLGVPETLRELIERQLGQLTAPDQQLLETASVAGMTFTAATVATGLEQAEEQVEEACLSLIRRKQFIREQGISHWPDGTVTAQYGFVHAFYHQVIYERVTPARCARLHRRVGERLEQAYTGRTTEIAAELAYHFEHGRDKGKTVHYLEHAGTTAIQRYAYAEAIQTLDKAIAVLTTLPGSGERDRQELALQARLIMALAATRSYAATNVESVHSRVRALCLSLQCPAASEDGDCTATRCLVTHTLQPVAVQWGLWIFYLTRAEYTKARTIAERMYTLGERDQDDSFLVAAYTALAASLYFLGEFTAAHDYAVHSCTLYNASRHGLLTALTGYEQGVLCRSYLAQILFLLGYPDKALSCMQDALTLAKTSAHPGSITLAHYYTGVILQLRRNPSKAQQAAEKAIAIAAPQGFAILLALSTILQGWTTAEQNEPVVGLHRIEEGFTIFATTEAQFFQPWNLALQAETCLRNSDPQTAAGLLDEALLLAASHKERCFVAELLRLKGECLLKQANQDSPEEAESTFRQALNIARGQRAKGWELRTAVSLARLWHAQGKNQLARDLLTPIYESFTEGFETADLRTAKALLIQLSEEHYGPDLVPGPH